MNEISDFITKAEIILSAEWLALDAGPIKYIGKGNRKLFSEQFEKTVDKRAAWLIKLDKVTKPVEISINEEAISDSTANILNWQHLLRPASIIQAYFGLDHWTATVTRWLKWNV